MTLIGRATLVEAVRAHGLFLESLKFQEYVPLAASNDAAAATGAQLILFSVKTPSTEEAARALAPQLTPGALVLSLQNGVDNVDRIRAATGIDAIPSVVYVAAEVIAPGRIKHTGRGDLIIGAPAERSTPDHGQLDLETVGQVFQRAGIPCKISADIEADLWTKLIMNCAYNAISAVSRARYGSIASFPWTRVVVKQVIEETVAVATKAGVRLAEIDLVEAGYKLAEAMPQALSSTAQDIARGRPTEIDSLNGYVVRRGSELGVDISVNRTLHALVKLLEESPS